ncbi:hypothetical protein NDU88_006343 [Pleurodeles waltl]|uniref:Uncharacterized protein n=1 Tax=Pleurodeles waltl TaxID=8319 RepID=A0AAV7MBX9_PLEWA|nr:hypothetical protein NDU88_006343 [Pleurodeles waltl]
MVRYATPGGELPGYIQCRFPIREVPRGSRRERHSRSRDSRHLDSRKHSNRGRTERAESRRGRSRRSRDPRYPGSREPKKRGWTARAEETKVAKRRDARSAEEGNIREDERELDSDIGEGGPLTSRSDTTEGQEGPRKPELRHVPGAAWLQQVQSCLRDKLRSIVGREEGGGDE